MCFVIRKDCITKYNITYCCSLYRYGLAMSCEESSCWVGDSVAVKFSLDYLATYERPWDF